jgi:hypothetical protein
MQAIAHTTTQRTRESGEEERSAGAGLWVTPGKTAGCVRRASLEK